MNAVIFPHWRLLAALPALVALALPANAETRLYQWKDENGRVHFSDQPPANKPVAVARVLGTQPKLPAVRQLTPAKLPEGRLAPLAVALPDYSALATGGLSGKLHVAADCISPSEIEWKDVQGPGSIFLDGNRRQLADAAATELRKLGYDTQVSSSDGHWQNMKVAGAYRLVPRIQLADLRVCLPRFTSAQLRQPDVPRLIQNASERAGLWLQVRWELWSKDSQQPLKIFVTEGVHLQWSEKTSLWLVSQEAMRDATRNLAGYPALSAALKTASTPAPVRETAQAAGNALGGLANSLIGGFTQQAKVAQAVALATPVKVMVVEYYMENDRWPTDLRALVPPGTELREPGLIDDMSLGPQGEIVLQFANAVAPGGWLRLTPRNNNINIQWSCRSNLPANALGGKNGFCQTAAR
ncbi:MAG: DUF4124 domain-containing protein [Moraxellaceae bacterium]|nr:DUF4124 domain-containing protein [Moraxellaceae bacterium]